MNAFSRGVAEREHPLGVSAYRYVVSVAHGKTRCVGAGSSYAVQFPTLVTLTCLFLLITYQ